MKLNNYISTFYIFCFLSFVLINYLYLPRPRLNKFSPNIYKNDKLAISRLFLDTNKLSNRIKRKINIGDSYLLSIDNNINLKITPLAFFSERELKLSDYSKYLPEIIIEADEIKSINQNNFGINRTGIANNYQACFFNKKDTHFLYEEDFVENVYRYNDFSHWLNVLNKSTLKLIERIDSESFNCLLITTTNPEIFDNNKNNILKIIFNNFEYE